MSPEWKEPDPLRPDAGNMNWRGLDDDTSLDDEEPPLPYQEAGAYQQFEPPIDDRDEIESVDEDGPIFSRFELFRQFVQQISPVLVPLVFGLLAFLLIFPLVFTGHAYLVKERFWPIVLVLIAIAVLQGMLLYYAGANNVLWSLAVFAGFCLFLLVWCFSIFGPVPAVILLLALLVLTFAMARMCLRPVPEGFVDIVQSFGKYTRTLYPGLNFLAPWEKVHENCRLSIRETTWACPPQRVTISRTEDVQLKATISYQLVPEDAYIAALQVKDWEESLHELFITTLQGIVPELSPNDFIPWEQLHPADDDFEDEASRWDLINSLLFQRIRDRVALWGVQINWVHIRDVEIVPHVPGTTEVVSSIRSAGNPGMQPPPPRTAEPRGMDHSHAADTTQPIQISSFPRRQSNPSLAASDKMFKEETLVQAYKQVQNNSITDPETIRKIAARFEAVANDPERSAHVSFDAVRAAQTLYKRALFFEEQKARESSEDQTHPNMSFHHESDDNLTGGG